jgi:hypothetical protein
LTIIPKRFKAGHELTFNLDHPMGAGHFASPDLGDAFLATQAMRNNGNLLFRRKMWAGRPMKLPDHILRRLLYRRGFGLIFAP